MDAAKSGTGTDVGFGLWAVGHGHCKLGNTGNLYWSGKADGCSRRRGSWLSEDSGSVLLRRGDGQDTNREP